MIEEFSNILVVEDEIFASKYLSQILKNLGYENIYETRNADDALSIVMSQKIDIVFMDINIEGAKDGIQCAKILNDQYFIPIIYTTAYADEETINEATKHNTYGYLVKPFEINDVRAVINVSKSLISTQHTQISEPKKSTPKEELNLGSNLSYNLHNKTLTQNKKSIDLTAKELHILDFFCKNIDINISYDTLRMEVWNDFDISNSTIRDTISRLKKKVPNLELKNIINFGYVLK